MSQTDGGPERGPTYRTPRWVKVFGIVTLIVILVIVVVLVTGLGGPHGPRRHAPSGDAGGGEVIVWSFTDAPGPGEAGFRISPSAAGQGSHRS